MATAKVTDVATGSSLRKTINSSIDNTETNLSNSIKSVAVSGGNIVTTKNNGSTSTSAVASNLTVTVSASTQAAISSGGSVGGGSFGGRSATVPTVVTGISANTYTLQNLLQQLVNKSHSHNSATITSAYNCYSDYCSSSSCIIRGSILTNTGYKDIAELKSGDIVLDNNLIERKVVDVITGVLEKRNAISIGNSYPIFTDDHIFLINNKEYGSCKTKNNYKEEKSYIIGTTNNIYDIKNTKSNYTIIKNEIMDFVLENINIIENHSYNTKTYMPVIEGSEWCIVDGFIVSCAISNND